MADNYRSFGITGITPVQFNNFETRWDTLNLSGVKISSIEYSPITQLLSIHIGGPNLVAFRTAFRAAINNFLGRFPDSDVVAVRGVKVKTAADIAAGL
mgnify:CR=1 FL=1